MLRTPRAALRLVWIGASISPVACSLVYDVHGYDAVDESEIEARGDGSVETDADASASEGGESVDGATFEAGDGPIVSAYRSAILDDAPVAYWRFGDRDGAEAKDEIGNAHPGRYYGGYVLGDPGLDDEGRSVRLNGTSGCVGIGPFFRFPGNAPFSVEVWVKVSAQATSVRLASTEGLPSATRQGWTFFINDGQPVFEGWTQLASQNHLAFGAYGGKGGLPALPIGSWNHVVATFAPALQEVWANGVLRNRDPASATPLADVGTLTVGCGGTGSGNVVGPVAGWLTEVAIYDRALTEVEIGHHFALGRP